MKRISAAIASAHVGDARELRRVVADAAAAAHEQHRGRAEPRHDLRVVAGARRQPDRLVAKLGDARRQRVLQRRRAMRGGDLVERLDATLSPRAFAMRARLGLEALDGCERKRVGQRAQIDREHHAAGNDVDRARRASMRPTVPTMPSSGCSRAIALERQRHLGRAGKGVAAQRHRHGAGVARFAGHGDAKPALADDAGDDAERLALRLQHRPLLDMHLDVARGVLRAGRRRRRYPSGSLP